MKRPTYSIMRDINDKTATKQEREIIKKKMKTILPLEIIADLIEKKTKKGKYNHIEKNIIIKKSEIARSERKGVEEWLEIIGTDRKRMGIEININDKNRETLLGKNASKRIETIQMSGMGRVTMGTKITKKNYIIKNADLMAIVDYREQLINYKTMESLNNCDSIQIDAGLLHGMQKRAGYINSYMQYEWRRRGMKKERIKFLTVKNLPELTWKYCFAH
jgi:hypothetical protein